MPEQTNIPEDGEPARKKLRSLPKLKAPWYLEARLQQRIRAGEIVERNWFFAKPIPAFAWGSGIFLCIFAAGYYTLMTTPYQEQQIPAPGEGTNSSHQNPVEGGATSLPAEQSDDPPVDNAGPSSTPPEATIESAPKSMQSESNGEDESGLTNNPGQDALDSLARRSRDSVQAKLDSLKNQQ